MASRLAKPQKFNIVNVSRYLKNLLWFLTRVLRFVDGKTALSPQKFVAGCSKSFVTSKSLCRWIQVEVRNERFLIIRMFCCGGNRAQFDFIFPLIHFFLACRQMTRVVNKNSSRDLCNLIKISLTIPPARKRRRKYQTHKLEPCEAKRKLNLIFSPSSDTEN